MKPETTHKYEPGHCPRCKQEFVCTPFSIANCNCSKIELSYEETQYIASQFNDCVCNKCLKELKYGFYLKFHHNKAG
jgi:hypothetical protein